MGSCRLPWPGRRVYPGADQGCVDPPSDTEYGNPYCRLVQCHMEPVSEKSKVKPGIITLVRVMK